MELKLERMRGREMELMLERKRGREMELMLERKMLEKKGGRWSLC